MRAVESPSVRATVYALGRVDMILADREKETVQIVNNAATDYDWNKGGGVVRNWLIESDRDKAELYDSDGFRTYYYGIGVLNKPSDWTIRPSQHR